LQAIDNDQLLKLAREKEFIVRLKCRPGDFRGAGSTIAEVTPAAKLNEELARSIATAFIWGHERTPAQDVEFAVEQLVEIAVRALSPGTNDPFTAMTCVDWLGEALCRLAERALPSPFRYDQHGALRVIAEPVTLASVVDTAFNQIRQYGRSAPAVLIRMLEALAVIAQGTERRDMLAALRRQAEMIVRGADDLAEEEDRNDVVRRGSALLERF
jgi:uncharacterized membrane protein